MSRNVDIGSVVFNMINQSRNNGLFFENRIQITANTTFVVPPNAKAVKFTAVGGGQAGVGSTGGPGAGYFEKTFYAPFTGLTTSFQLTVGAAGGNTVLANSAGTTIATAFGATAISGANPVGVGGTASGGDINSNGSPGGTSPGRGGSSGGPFGPGVYDSTYAGRWVHFQESFTNDNVKNFMIINAYTATPGTSVGVSGGLFGTSGYGGTGGIGGNGATGATGGTGGFGGNGGNGAFPGGIGGVGGFGGYGGNGAIGQDPGPAAGSGGAGGFGGGGGTGGPFGSPLALANGGAGGFGGGGGARGNGTPGAGGAGAFIVEWTYQLPNKVGA